MGGTIGVESALGVGSTFWFALPYELAPEEELTEEVSPLEEVRGTTQLRGLHVLVAEDNLVNQKLVKTMLKRMGHTSKVVNNGEKAVDEIKAHGQAYDLVLMDIQMPVLGGIEATKLIRDMGYSDLPIFAMTASVQWTKFAELGLDDWICKPIPLSILKEKLRQLQERNDNSQTEGLMKPDEYASII